MIHFKNKFGFTLVESLMAMAIMALLLTPLFISQATIVQNLVGSDLLLRRIFIAENFLFDARIAADGEQQFTMEKKIEDPTTVLKYQANLSSKKSTFKDFEDLVHEQTTIEWEEDGKKRQEMLVTFIYKPQPKKANK